MIRPQKLLWTQPKPTSFPPVKSALLSDSQITLKTQAIALVVKENLIEKTGITLAQETIARGVTLSEGIITTTVIICLICNKCPCSRAISSSLNWVLCFPSIRVAFYSHWIWWILINNCLVNSHKLSQAMVNHKLSKLKIKKSMNLIQWSICRNKRFYNRHICSKILLTIKFKVYHLTPAGLLRV